MIDKLIYISFFIGGVLLGSFYNVVGSRVPKNESIVKPKSHCVRCKHELKWYELIPIFSYIFLGGKCRNCKQTISIMYPFIELFTGILFTVCYHSFGFSVDLVIALSICSLLSIVIVSDINYMIIPDMFILIPSIIIIICNFLKFGFLGGLKTILFGIISFLILYLIMLLGNKLFKKESMGGADIKLFFVVGLIFNPLISLLVLLVASFVSFPIAVILLLKNKERVIPFGPFIVLSMLFIYFTKLDFIKVLEFLKNL